MNGIHKKTLEDLEFPMVLQQVSELCITALGNHEAQNIAPMRSNEQLMVALNHTNEYLSSFYNDNRIPNHGFDSIAKELKLLKIENTYLDIHGLKKIASISLTTNTIIIFLNKFKEYYPTLNDFASKIEVTKILIEKVDNIIDRFGDIKDYFRRPLAKKHYTINL